MRGFQTTQTEAQMTLVQLTVCTSNQLHFTELNFKKLHIQYLQSSRQKLSNPKLESCQEINPMVKLRLQTKGLFAKDTV